MIDKADYDTNGEVNTTQPGWRNILCKIPRLPQEERMYKRKRGEFGFILLICPDRRNTAFVKDIVKKYTKPGNLVVDACAGTFCVANGFMLLPKHRSFTGCKVDVSCMTKRRLQLILPHA